MQMMSHQIENVKKFKIIKKEPNRNSEVEG